MLLLTAYLNGVKVDLTSASLDAILDWHESGQRFEMADGCKKLGRIRRSFYGRWAFAHFGKSNCPGESPEHVEAKANLAKLCRRYLRADSVHVEFAVPDNPHQIDVMAVTERGVRWALEIQRSHQTPDETHGRTRVLHGLGYMVAWFFFQPGQLKHVHDQPHVVHFLTSPELTELRPASPSGRRGAKLAKFEEPPRTVAAADMINHLLAGEMKWLDRTTFTHARRGGGTVSTFACPCGTNGVYPQVTPSCRHVAACGFDAGSVMDCPDFDWPKHLRRNPDLIPDGLELGLCFRTRRGTTWSRCHGCERNIRAKPSKRSLEPARKILRISVALHPSGIGQSEVGHWCGIAGQRCHQPIAGQKPVAKGQARLEI